MQYHVLINFNCVVQVKLHETGFKKVFNLHDSIRQVEELAEDKLEGVGRVSASMKPPVVDKVRDLLFLAFVCKDRVLKQNQAINKMSQQD